MASGDILIEWTPQAGEPPTANFATADLTAQNHPVIDFDDGGAESIRFSGVMPPHYAGTTGVTIHLHYAMTTAIANDVELNTSFERIGDQQQNIHTGEGFAAAQITAETTVPGTAGLVDIITSTHTDGAQMDSVVADEGFRLNVKRVVVSGTDAAGDLELRFVAIKET